MKEENQVNYKKNDSLTVEIEDMGSEGEGIGKVDGFTVFVKDAVIGDFVEAKIVKTKTNYAYARMEKVINPSPFRTKPECPYHRQCGGCQIQALSYEKQLELKQKKIRNNLMRIGGFDQTFLESVMDPIVGMDHPYRYRNKAQYPVGTDKDGKLVTGFYAGHTHDIIHNTNCLLGAESNRDILEEILSYMMENRIKAYDEKTGKGLIRHILIRTGFTSGEIMVCLVVNKSPSDLPNQDKLLEKLAKIHGMTSVSISFNTEKTNVIMGKEVRTIWGNDTISDTIHVRDMTKKDCPHTGQELTFKISPLSFYQVNPLQTEKLYSLALQYAGLTGKESVWDLYCGIGTISLFLSKSAKKVYGVEVIPQAIENARENARNNGIKNAEFFMGKAEEVLPAFYRRDSIYGRSDRKRIEKGSSFADKEEADLLHPDVIVVDPPRKGCDRLCLDTMLKMQPDRIVYVSCDSATLARDLKILCDGGYRLERVRGVDMFPQTVSVETVCALSKLSSAKEYTEVTADMDEMDLNFVEAKATNNEIHDWV